MYSTHNERKSVVAERFISSIHDFNITIINICILIVNEYNNTYHRAIRMKPINIKDNKYIDFGKESNVKDPNFKLVII